MSEGTFRLRVRYRKDGRLRYLSHLELVRAQERMIRRAGIPYAITNGFSPHMKVSFGPALGVGTGGLEEYLDLWLNTYTDADDALGRLRASCADDLAPDRAVYVAEREPALAAALSISHYRIRCTCGPASGEEAPAALDGAVTAICERGVIELERRKPSKKGATTKTLDLSQLLYRRPGIVSVEDGMVCDLWTRFDNAGALRPEVFMGEMAVESGIPLCLDDLVRIEQFSEDTDGVLHKPLD